MPDSHRPLSSRRRSTRVRLPRRALGPPHAPQLTSHPGYSAPTGRCGRPTPTHLRGLEHSQPPTRSIPSAFPIDHRHQVARLAEPPAFESRRGQLPPTSPEIDDTTVPTLQELIDDLEPSELQRRKYTRSTTTGSDSE